MDSTDAAAGWEAAYTDGPPPWDIGRPQPSLLHLADAGELRSPLLDSGCGTGEHTLMAAERGLDALGIDVSARAIAAARRKAAERGIPARFEVGDVLALDRLGQRFATVIDSGVFHVFDDADRARYVRSLASATEPGGTLHLMCFSELTPGSNGPRRVTQAELRAAFADGWEVASIQATRFAVRSGWESAPHAWLARIVRSSAE